MKSAFLRTLLVNQNLDNYFDTYIFTLPLIEYQLLFDLLHFFFPCIFVALSVFLFIFLNKQLIDLRQGWYCYQAPFGPPFALVQGTLVAHGIKFKEIALEFCPAIERGSVAWVGSGPDFFISLANHVEWKKAYTVFGSVLPRDMEIVEKISQLPTKPEVWSNVKVSVLEKPVMLQFQRIR